jgi:hypothetical protein
MTRSPARGLEPRNCEVCGNEFQPYRDYTTTCSRRCYNNTERAKKSAKEYRSQREVKDRKNLVRRVEINPARREVNMRMNLRRYGISPDQYREMVAAQNNRCAICGEEPDPNGIKAASRLHVDHDHVTGRNRDLLCCRCNQGIGYFKDDPALFRAAADYIERHRRAEA